MVATQKFRVDSFLGALAIKAPCVVVTNVNLTLSGEQTVNGVAVVTGDRVLVKNQTVQSENGIYEVETSAWVRSGDWDGSRDVVNGTLVVVAGDPVAIYQMTGTDPITIGTDNVTFSVLTELGLTALLASVLTGEGASKLGIEDSAGKITATTVEGALAEIFGTESVYVSEVNSQRNNSIVLLNVTGLTAIPLTINEKYFIEFGFRVETFAASDLKWRFQANNGLTASWGFAWTAHSSDDTTWESGTGTGFDVDQLINGVNAEDCMVVGFGYLQPSAGGDFDVEFAQQVAVAENTTFLVGSWVRVTKLT